MAERWEEQGDAEQAELERRNVEIELAAAQLEQDRAALIDRRQASLGTKGQEPSL